MYELPVLTFSIESKTNKANRSLPGEQGQELSMPKVTLSSSHRCSQVDAPQAEKRINCKK